MMAELGHSLLLTALVLSILGIMGGAYFHRKATGFQKKTMQAPLDNAVFSNITTSFLKINLGFICGCLVGALGVLVASFIQTDLSLRSVALNSSNLDPWIYRLVSVWSHHEGS